MSSFFLSIYERFEKRPLLRWGVFLFCVVVCSCLAAEITFDEDITSFFEAGKGETQTALFEHLKIKDKIIVSVSGDDPDAMIDAAELFVEQLQPAIEEGAIRSVTDGIDRSAMEKCIDFIYEYLPIFLTDEDFTRMAEAVSPDNIEQSVAGVYSMLASASGMVVGEVLLRDPLHLGSHLLRQFERFDAYVQYELYADRIFTKDMSSLLLFIDPAYGMGDTGQNEHLVDLLERAARAASADGVRITCFGGPVVAVYNARQIKKDTTVTLSIALLVILLVILLSFRNKWSVPLIIVPPAFGALFALAAVWVIQGSISAIAVGAGAVVLGVALSYSIHFISHINHTNDPRQVITDLAAPLTIGCLTTIGAFAALMFTSSALLHDIGLFSLFTLIGTTLCCLIFLPHFVGKFDNRRRSPLLNFIERGNAYSYEDNKWILLFIGALTIVSLFFYRDVRFDTEMSGLNYVPAEVERAEAETGEMTGETSKSIFLVSSAENLADLVARYEALGDLLEACKKEHKITDCILLDNFVIAPDVQRARIAKWRAFWDENRDTTVALLERFARAAGFKENAFSRFSDLLGREFAVCEYTSDEVGEVPALREWIEIHGSSEILISRLLLEEEMKGEVYAAIAAIPGTAIIDRTWFSSIMLENTVDDFNYILLISSLIVFVALLLSYGRLELTLLTFLPMCISWVIILGLMALFDIPFNVVNIILATFIFGIGDDFSIFIMDGLLQEYKSGQKLLGAHKTAIFFSAFTAIVGMGVMIFAKHPALRSIAFISVLGLSVVVFVAYTVQPLLFRLFIGSPARKGKFPYTILSILNTIYCFSYFVAGCMIIRLYMALSALLPIRRQRKKDALHRVIFRFTRLFLKTMLTVKTIRNNPCGETFEKPALVIANHQSFIDILLLLSTTPKMVMVTNRWVWRSPFFGRIVRAADFQQTEAGYDELAASLKRQVEAGYSVVIFPEGTRSADCRIQRFHKGAFYLAEKLGLDIVPVVLYGTGQLSSKTQPFHIKSGSVVVEIVKRISADDASFGRTYQERAKRYRAWFVEAYARMNERYGRADNAYFRDALIRNYIYKGPVLEWYMRVKCRMDGYYDLWDRLIPRNAFAVDVGCGYGQLCFMLGMLAPERFMLGIDYDREKIELARHCFLCKGRIGFECADMRELPWPSADAFIFNDSLHYVAAEKQFELLARAVSHLRENGMIVVRDGDALDVLKHARIERSERWSTKILKFNKTTEKLSYVDSAGMKAFAAAHHLSLQIRRCDRTSSETLYVFRKK